MKSNSDKHKSAIFRLDDVILIQYYACRVVISDNRLVVNYRETFAKCMINDLEGEIYIWTGAYTSITVIVVSL